MLRSIQGVAYNMKVQSDRMNIIANNVANINTHAYKKEVVSVKSFDDVLVNAMQYNTGEKINQLGSLNMGNSIDQQRTVFEQGFMEKTDFSTDFGIRGNGFYVLDTPQGIQYSRSGNFSFNKDGYLVTQDGSYVMGEKGRVQIPSRKIKVDTSGNIFDSGSIDNIVNIDKLKIVEFADLKLLNKTGNGNYANTDVTNLRPSLSTEILQGFLESSNVDSVEETRDMMDAKRNFESCQQVIKMLDDTYGKAVSEIGRL